MKALIATISLLLLLALPESGPAQVQGGTGKMGFQLSVYGRVRVNTPFWTGGTRQVDRLSFLAALDSTHVFDYTQDADTVLPPFLIIGGVADTIATVLTDNGFLNNPPNIQVRVTVYAWSNDDFLIVKFTTKNIHTATYPLYLGAFVVPKPSNIYGGETVAYDATKKVAYYYRTSQTPYVGVKVLSGNPYSFHALDWDVYSPDPAADAASDSTRWRMTALPGFDSPLTAGVDGSAMNLNAGLRTIAPGDSASVFYGVIFTNSLASLLLEADSAQIRYNSRLTSVDEHSDGLPERYSLSQNYPNPFNPSTNIAFELANAGLTVLKVYNILGEEIATLVNEQLAPGAYTATFNADNLPTGVYLYKLTSGTHSSAKRMLLIR